MKTQKNKIAAITIVIFFILSTISSLAHYANKNAHTPPYTIPTFAYISVQPNPVGIGQQASLNFWIDQVPPTANQAWGDRWGNFTVKVTQPDGTIENLGPFTSDAAGGAHAWYVPSKIGNYTFVFTFGGQTLAGNNLAPGFTKASYPNIGDYYAPSTSVSYVLNVGQEPSPHSAEQSASNRLLATPNILKQLSMVPDQRKLAWRRHRRKRRMHIQFYLKLRSILYSAKHCPHSLDKGIRTWRTHRRRIRRQHGGQHDDVNFTVRMQVRRNSHQRSTLLH